MLIYNENHNSTIKICDERIIGTGLQTIDHDDGILIFFICAVNDTDEDGIVSVNDFKELWIYSISDESIRKIRMNNSTVLGYNLVPNSKNILITLGYDRNNDNVFKSQTEPQYLMSYQYEQDTLVRIVDKGLEKELQSLIDMY